MVPSRRSGVVSVLVLASIMATPATGQSSQAAFLEVAYGGAFPGDGAATAAAGLGDLDGDGHADFALGFPFADTPQGAGAGRVLVVSGVDRSVRFVLEGDGPGDGFGKAIAAAGDVDADGVRDLVVGAPFGPAPTFGYVRVHSGRDGSVLWTHLVAGDSAGTHFGEAVAGDADFDADGHADIVVLQHGASASPSGTVRAYSGATGAVLHGFSGHPVLFGMYYVGALPDVDGDGHDEILYGTFAEFQTSVRVHSGADGRMLHVVMEQGHAASDAGDVDGDGTHDLLMHSGQVLSGATWSPVLQLSQAGVPHGLGDVDGDGVPDLAVGGRVYAGADARWLYTAANSGALLPAGDVDGDGRVDVLALAFHAVPEEAVSPAPLLLSRTRLQATLHGDVAQAGFGREVAIVGDVDGDGYADLVAGLSFDDSAGADAGLVRVISGSDGATLHEWAGDSAGDEFGWAVAGAGDVDADGVPDVVVGSPAEWSGGSLVGGARVFSGADGRLLFAAFGTAAFGRFGHAVAAAGDVNGDGFGDVAVGAPRTPDVSQLRGSVTVLAGPDGAVLYEVSGPETQMLLGRSVAGAGDIDGDGLADVVAGAPGTTIGGVPDVGRALLLSGAGGAPLGGFDGLETERSFGGALDTLGDVDGDGVTDFIIGSRWLEAFGSLAIHHDRALVVSGATGVRLATWTMAAGPEQGVPAVAGAGDVDADGTPDAVVGRLTPDGSGFVEVRSGRTGGMLLTEPGLPGDELGAAVAGGHDVNGDGRADVVLGIPGEDGGGPGAGAIRVLGVSPVNPPWTFLGQALEGAQGLPQLVGAGTLAPASVVSLELTGALATTRTALVAGLRDVSLPFKGGTIVPSADVVHWPISTSATGAWTLGAHWPAGPPTASAIFLQVWIVDASGAQGFSASNALRAGMP